MDMRSAVLQTTAERIERATDLPSPPAGLSSGAGVADASPAQAPLDARDLQRLLEVELPLKPAAPTETPPFQGTKPETTSRPLRRVGKITLGAALVLAFGVVPIRTLLQTSSVEAVVNARVVTLRAPIGGEVEASMENLTRSGIVQRGTPLLAVVDRRADRNRLDDLRRQLDHLVNERTAIDAKLGAASALETDLTRQAALFRQGRVAQLTARSSELANMIVAAGAQRDEAVAARSRAASLSRTGSVSSAELDRLTRAAMVATQTEAATRNRLAATEVELDAAKIGVFIGDSTSDRPSSMQRAEELRQQVANWHADRIALLAEGDRLTQDVAVEQERYRDHAREAMNLPVAGRIWEVMVSPGEQVRVGQDLVRILDCSTALVTANVTESVYNRLRVGSVARFVPADGGADLDGRVMGLSGQAGTPANLAIVPAVLVKEPYRVTVAVPNLAAQQACGVGRTGRVVFGDPAREAS